MSDVILDAAVAVAVGRAQNPEIKDWLVRRRKAGHRNWLYVAQQSEMLQPVDFGVRERNHIESWRE